jgi:hypothetical protein
VVLQVFPKGEPLIDRPENNHGPCVDVYTQVFLMVVGERLVFVLGQWGLSLVITKNPHRKYPDRALALITVKMASRSAAFMLSSTNVTYWKPGRMPPAAVGRVDQAPCLSSCGCVLGALVGPVDGWRPSVDPVPWRL